MVRAFIMVKVDAGQTETVRDEIAAFDSITEAHVVAGAFDIIAEAEAEEVYDVMHSAASEIRGLSDVTDTKTYICLE